MSFKYFKKMGENFENVKTNKTIRYDQFAYASPPIPLMILRTL